MKKIICSLVIALMALTASAQSKSTWGVKAGAGVSNYRISMEGLSAKISLGNRAGFFVGGVYNYQFHKNWGLQAELQYSYEGTALRISGDDVQALYKKIKDAELPAGVPDKFQAHVNMHQLRMPIMVKYSVQGLSVMAGPYVSYRLGLKADTSSDTKDYVMKMGLDEQEWNDNIDKVNSVMKDNLRKFDVGAALGVEYAFKNGIFMDLHYNFSFLNNLVKEADITSVEPNSPKMKWKEVIGVHPTVRYQALQIGVGYRF